MSTYLEVTARNAECHSLVAALPDRLLVRLPLLGQPRLEVVRGLGLLLRPPPGLRQLLPQRGHLGLAVRQPVSVVIGVGFSIISFSVIESFTVSMNEICV